MLINDDVIRVRVTAGAGIIVANSWCRPTDGPNVLTFVHFILLYQSVSHFEFF